MILQFNSEIQEAIVKGFCNQSISYELFMSHCGVFLNKVTCNLGKTFELLFQLILIQFCRIITLFIINI
jgi:hypothetical protein